MILSEQTRSRIRNTLGVLKILGGVVLLAAVSWEVIYGNRVHLSGLYLHIQLAVCILFLADFFVRWVAAEPHSRFFLHNIAFFVISVPYLNILIWTGLHPPHEVAMLIGLMPLARAFLASFIVVKWLASGKVNRLFASYIFTVVVVTYLSALVFYDYEASVNPKLNGFGDAFWWAWMNVTTVGAEIFAVTPIGKIITVVLPTLGMMMFPIFTTYILQDYAGLNKAKKESKKQP